MKHKYFIYQWTSQDFGVDRKIFSSFECGVHIPTPLHIYSHVYRALVCLDVYIFTYILYIIHMYIHIHNMYVHIFIE